MSELVRFSGYQAIEEKPRLILPRGGYIAVILSVHLEDSAFARKRMIFKVEISEGPYKNFYQRDYESRQGGIYEARYHGTYSILYPLGDATPEDQIFVDRFNLTMGAIESSNPNFQWNWQLSSLKGLSVGLSVREVEYNGVTSTEIGKFIPISMIQSGRFRPMAKRIGQPAPSSDTPAQSGIPKIPGMQTPPAIPKSPITYGASAFPNSQTAQPQETKPKPSETYIEVDDDTCPF